MKAILILLIAIMLQACNRPVKMPDHAAEPEKATVSDITAISDDTVKPVYSAEDELRIKKDSLSRVQKVFPFMSKYSFKAFEAIAFKGEPAPPDFKGNPYASDPEYVAFITKGCKKGINFGGHYTLIEKGCGALCEHLFMVDRRNGKIFTGNFGLKKEDGYYGFKYKKDSYLLIANATSLIDASTDQFDEFSIKPEVFKWDNDAFIKLE